MKNRKHNYRTGRVLSYFRPHNDADFSLLDYIHAVSAVALQRQSSLTITVSINQSITEHS